MLPPATIAELRDALAHAVERRDRAEALDLSFRLLQEKLVRLAQFIGLRPQEAEEAVQEAFITAQQSWGRFDGANIEAWLWVLTRDCARGIRKKNNSHPVCPIDGVEEASLTPPDPLAFRDLVSAINTIHAKLNPVNQAILEGMVEEKTDEDIRRDIVERRDGSLTGVAIRIRKTRLRYELMEQLGYTRNT